MDKQRELLFGLMAYQKGLIDADALAETCGGRLADLGGTVAGTLVEQGLLTIEQRTRLEEVVREELAAHGDDARATIEANLDGRALDALRAASPAPPASPDGQTAAYQPSGPVLIGSLGAEDHESRERYTLTHLYAKGGMGQVWLAHDPALGREIALKELRPDQVGSDTICTRFLAEARVTAQLEHPGIVPVYELGDQDLPYYTMRFVKGGTLGQAARAYHKGRVAGRADQVGMIKLLGAFVGICHALAYAHSKGFIHRDLKGQNVVLGDFGEVIVLDWGLAKRIRGGPAGAPRDAHELPDEADRPAAAAEPEATLLPDESRAPRADAGPAQEMTLKGQVLGTPAFMAPEQAEGRQDETDERTDVYGLGAILYEILTGQPPFHAKTTEELLRKVRKESPTPPRRINPAVDPALQAICLKALSKAPGDRYPLASDLAQDVQRFLADEPVGAWPEPWTRRAARWARKHRTAVAAAAVLLLTATAALAISTVLISRERNEATLQGEQARAAVDDMYVKVAENLLEDRLDPLQKEMLEKALNYYVKFTSYAAHTPQVRLENGQAYRRMGEIHRKLGRADEADGAFRKALAVLEPLAAERPDDPEAARVLALTRGRRGDFLVRAGRFDEAAPLFAQAAEAAERLADDPPPETRDFWLLARVLRSQGELARRKGDLKGARTKLARACDLLERVVNDDPKSPEARNDLAQASDFLGRVARDLGDTERYEKSCRRAYELLDALIAEFPTVPRYREAMSHVCNGLGQFERGVGRPADCEAHWRRELKETERLAGDFPDRPEYRRLLAGACSNLGGILAEQERFADAEPILRRGIEVGSALLKAFPGDREASFDLGTCLYNLGYLQLKGGQPDAALASLTRAGEIVAEQSGGPQGLPRARRLLAMVLRFQGEALDELERPGADQVYRKSVALLEKLTAEVPDNVDYQVDYAQSLNKLADKLVDARQGDEAEACYQRALAALDREQASPLPHEGQLEKARVLSNLANFRGEAKRPGADDLFRQAIALADKLAAGTPPASKDHQVAAVARNNLGEMLRARGEVAAALAAFGASVDRFRAIVAANPKSIMDRYYLGHVYDEQGSTLVKAGKPAEAKLALEQAVTQHATILKANPRFQPSRGALIGMLVRLADLNLSLGDYAGVRQAALELSHAGADSGKLQFEAARYVARSLIKLKADTGLPSSDKEVLTRDALGRTVVMLRQAVDLDSSLAGTIRTDATFKELLEKPEFRALLESVVNAAR